MSKHSTPTYLCTCTCLYIAYIYIYWLCKSSPAAVVAQDVGGIHYWSPGLRNPKLESAWPRDFFCSNGWDYCKKHNILDSTALLRGFLITTSSSVLRSNHPAKSTHQISIKSAPAAPRPGEKTSKGRMFNIEHQHQIKTNNIRQAK